MKFSYRHSYDPEFVKKVERGEAPKWVRKLYFSKVLERLLYNGQSTNSVKQPIPIYALIYEVLDMEEEEPDEYYLNHTAAIDVIRNLIMGIP